MKTYADEPAYPDKNNSGLTKREYFAAIALKGILSDPEESADEYESEDGEDGGEMEMSSQGNPMENRRMDGESCMECCCRMAVEHADQLIKELNK
jgi:hypothetical protein